MLRPSCLFAVLSVVALVPATHAQYALAAQWTPDARWVQGISGRREHSESDVGVIRGRMPGSGCRSSLMEDNDVPIVVRFDSTETTLVGRATNVVNAVAAFRGSAWDISDPDAPRRLNMILRELPMAVLDTAWTLAAREPLFVMASTYDGTGTTYLDLNVGLQLSDCLYGLYLEPSNGSAAGPVTLDVRPAYVNAPFARREGPRAEVSWTYREPQGASFQIRRVREGAGAGPVIGSAPLESHFFLDESVPAEGEYTYRVEVVDADGRVVHVSPITAEPTLSSSHHLTVLGRYATPRSEASDVWGYVGPDGREYALLNSVGLTVVDVTNPALPVEVAHIPGGASDIEAFGHHVYVTHDSGPVQVIDIADPRAPVLVREFSNFPGTPTAGVHTLSIADGRLYLNGNGGFSVWSLSDPARPSLLGRYGGGYVHDVLARGDTVYAALIYGDGVDVVDVSDPTQPTRIANFTYPGAGAHNICSTADGRYLFVGDEIGTSGRWTRVFDVSDAQNVELVAEIIVDPTAIVHNCHIVGDRLFLAHYNRGVRVWDVSDPTAPHEIAYHDFEGVGQSGIWTVWPHLPSGHLLASDIQNGLLVLELDGSVAAEPPPTEATAALTLAPNPTAGEADARVTLAAPATVALAVYDVLGRRVAHLAETDLAAGSHRLAVPTTALPAGVYVVRLSVDGQPAGVQTLSLAR